MRRLMLLVVAMSFLGATSGCKCVFPHGICDCEFDDYCASRSPWIRFAPAPVPVVGEPIPAPAKDAPPAPKDL